METLQEFKAGFFKALAHPTRIAILERLRGHEQSVGQLQEHLGLDQSVVSQQLAVLRGQGILGAHKQGTVVRYQVRDPVIYELLDVARQIFNKRLSVTQALLAELRAEGRRGRARPERSARR